MRAMSWRGIPTHIGAHFPTYLALFTIVSALAITSFFPVYFRNDDSVYLSWVCHHDNPLSAFDRAQAPLFAVFRPLQNLTWWLLYHAFGLNPWPYQIVVTILYGLAFVFFYKLVLLLFSQRVALISLAAHVCIFFYLAYVIFWFSDLTFILEMLLMNLGLYLLVRAMQRRSTLLWGILAYVGAIWSKEPSILITPAVISGYLASDWKSLDRRGRTRGLMLVGLLLGIAILWIAFNRHLGGRKGVDFSSGLQAVAAFLVERLAFYGRYLTSDLGIIIWISTLFLGLRCLIGGSQGQPLRHLYLPLVLSIIVSAAIMPADSMAPILLFLAFIPILARRRRESAAVLWFALPFAGITTLIFMNRTYMLEASFGIAIVVGAGLAEIWSGLAADLRRLRPRVKRLILVVTTVVACLCVVTVGRGVGGKLEALQVVSEKRRNFREVFDFIRSNPSELRGHLVLIEYEDMGTSLDHVLARGDLEKAHLQKTMDTVDNLQRFMSVAGAGEVPIHNLQWFLENENVEECALFVMSSHEQEFLDGLDLTKELLYAAERTREAAYLYAVKR